MGWQLPADHVDAVKHPLRCFQDPDLKRAAVVLGSTGQPLARSGRLCEVYEVRSAGSHQRWAVKCYREERPGLEEHYRALGEHLHQLHSPYLMSFQYLDRGLSVRGRCFPVLKMRWADGVPLNAWVAEAADRPEALKQLARAWLRLLPELRRLGIAHGALQHDHVLVSGDGQREPPALRLVDYDAMYVPERHGCRPPEAGHPNYQHPQRHWEHVRNAESDRFAGLVIYTALVAVAAGGSMLWQRYDTGDNLLFKESDFQEPANSAVFRALWRRPEPSVRALAGHLLLAAVGSGREIPLLDRLAENARTTVGGDPDALPEFTLTDEQRRQVDTLLKGDVGEPPPPARAIPVTPVAPRQKETFGILLVDDDGESGLQPATDDDNFDLVVGSDPELNLPPPVATQVPAAVIRPVEAAPLALAPMLIDDPNMRTYRLEAWMPEQVAVMKVQGFVDAATGEVLASEPGLMRVQLLDPYDLAEQPKPGLLGWLGLAPQPQRKPRVLASLEFEMDFKETTHQKRLHVILRIRPGTECPPPAKWRAYCDKIYCEVRAFLMGIV